MIFSLEQQTNFIQLKNAQLQSELEAERRHMLKDISLKTFLNTA